MNSLKKRVGLFTTAALTCVLLVGCTPKSEAVKEKETTTETVPTADSSVEMNIKTIEAVLKEELNGPDEKFVQLSKAALYGTEDPNSVKQKENDMKLASYIKEKYLPYFTEDGLTKAESIGMLYQYQSMFYFDAEYTLRLVDSEVKQSDIDTASNQYHIKATVELTAPGKDPSLHKLRGKAIFSTKEGKIGDFQLSQKDSTLSNKLFELAEKD